MFERFTDRARKVMALANQQCQRLNHEYIGPEHILLGLCAEGTCVGANVLKNLGVDLRVCRAAVDAIVTAGPDKIIMGKMPQTEAAKRVVEKAIETARELNLNYVGTEHLLLGLIGVQDTIASKALTETFSLTFEKVQAATIALLGLKDDKAEVTGEAAFSFVMGNAKQQEALRDEFAKIVLSGFMRHEDTMKRPLDEVATKCWEIADAMIAARAKAASPPPQIPHI